ncbi:hypothetical protein ACGFZ9_41330 [Streptomyces mirabilis]|uniref:hypothetical protein n=1 Tax=Streptomyces mirabilis TaxID=68239 RepID=UPI00371B7BFE
MLTIPGLPRLHIDGAWQTTVESWTRSNGRLRLRERDNEVVVDVDVPDQQLSLLVHEPPWVTDAHPDLDHVPDS